MSDQKDMVSFRYGGARALVALHDYWMRRFAEVWLEAHNREISAWEKNDPDVELVSYALRHVITSSRNYMMWICEKLQLPDPEIDPPPSKDKIEEQFPEYLEHLLQRWKLPLTGITEEQAYQAYESRWGVQYCIDAMLEHAVMHPIRHIHQLERFIREYGGNDEKRD